MSIEISGNESEDGFDIWLLTIVYIENRDFWLVNNYDER